MEGFTQDHVDAFFGFAVSDLKLPRLRTMLRMFHDLFKHDGACTVWGFRKVTETSTSSTRRNSIPGRNELLNIEESHTNNRMRVEYLCLRVNNERRVQMHM